MSTSYIRVSNDGLNGSGKTCTTAQLAVGLAKEYGDGADVHVFDSSDRWRTWKKLIFDVEKVRLHIHYGESIAVLQKAAEAAMKGPCSVFVSDDLTVPWLEGVRSFAHENGNLTFERRQQLLNEWKQGFVHIFKHGPFDSLACGRMGYVWENIEDAETGEEKLHQGDAKFNAGGGENFGYDADLELAMRRRSRKILGLFRGKLTVEHIVDVRKDAHNIINGQQFAFQDWTGPYRPGMYKPVLDAFRPHIDFVRSLDRTTFDGESSDNLIVGGKTAWAKDQSERASLLQEYDTNLDIAFPSGEGKSKLAKMFINLTTELLTGSVSRLRMEEESPTPLLREARDVAKVIRKRVEAGEIPTNQESLKVLVGLSSDEIRHPGKNITLLEAMGLKTLAQTKKPQPVVGLMDRTVRDEVAGD